MFVLNKNLLVLLNVFRVQKNMDMLKMSVKMFNDMEVAISAIIYRTCYQSD